MRKAHYHASTDRMRQTDMDNLAVNNEAEDE